MSLKSNEIFVLRGVGVLALLTLSICSTIAAEPPASRSAEGEVKLLPPVSIFVGRSTLVQSTFPIRRVSVTDPKIADIQVLTPTQVLVSGKSVGATDVIMSGDSAVELPVVVTVDHAGLRNELAKLLPNENLDVRTSNDVLIITGMLSRAEEVQSLHRYLEVAGMKYVDMTTLAGVPQVQIKVMLAEANRTAIRTLGINALQSGSAFFGGSVVGADGGGAVNPISIGVPSGSALTGIPFQYTSAASVGTAATLFAGFPRANLEFFIQALAENQYLRVLAEPSLVALSGQEASFLAGGEFPIPVVQAQTTTTSVTIEYKEFGVRLRFQPTVIGDGRIRLHVAPEYSELSTGPGAVTIQGFNIPAIVTRRAETTLELNNGQTFAMAGLISQETQARSSRVPGLGDLPVLGSLFRSVRYQLQDTELVLLVTASLVEPGSIKSNTPIPGMTNVVPNDWELYSMGRIEGSTPGKVSPADADWMRQAGLHRLRGPGAWADYDPTSAQNTPTQSAPAQNAPPKAQ